jgi:hypothetical protein
MWRCESCGAEYNSFEEMTHHLASHNSSSINSNNTSQLNSLSDSTSMLRKSEYLIILCTVSNATLIIENVQGNSTLKGGQIFYVYRAGYGIYCE